MIEDFGDLEVEAEFDDIDSPRLLHFGFRKKRLRVFQRGLIVESNKGSVAIAHSRIRSCTTEEVEHFINSRPSGLVVQVSLNLADPDELVTATFHHWPVTRWGLRVGGFPEIDPVLQRAIAACASAADSNSTHERS